MNTTKRRVLGHLLMAALWLPVISHGASSSRGSAEAKGHAWFLPTLSENHDAVCQIVVRDAQKLFLTGQGLWERYAKPDEVALGDLRRIEDPYSVELDGHTIYLGSYLHPGCGGACETYQNVATAEHHESREELEPFLDVSPPSAEWSVFFVDSRRRYFLFQPDERENLLVYRLKSDAHWERSCVVAMQPDRVLVHPEELGAAANAALTDFQVAVHGLMRDAGYRCGTAETHGRWWSRFVQTLPGVLYRPWSLREENLPNFDLRDSYKDDLAGLELWALGGLSEHDSLIAYKAALQQTTTVLSHFYEAAFKWDSWASEEMASAALRGVVSETIRFDGKPSFGQEGERALREAILNGEKLSALRAIDLDWTRLDRGHSDNLLSVAVLRPDVLAWLLSKGIDPNHANEFGKTPLMYAAQRNQLDSVKVLLAKGANPNARTLIPTDPMDTCGYTLKVSGMTPLHYAVRYASPELIRVLLDHDAAPYLAAERETHYPPARETPLDWLARYAGPASVERNPNIPDSRRDEVATWLTVRPEDVAQMTDALVRQGEEFYQRGEVSKAFDALFRAVTLAPENERALGDMSLVALRRGEIELSLQTSDKLKRSDSPAVRAKAWFNLASACEALKSSDSFHYRVQRYCQQSVADMLYESLRAEDSSVRRKALEHKLEAESDRLCYVPERGMIIHLFRSPEGDEKQAQRLYVINAPGSAPAPNELAWSADEWTLKTGWQTRRVVPVMAATLSLGDREVTAFDGDAQFPKTGALFGHVCEWRK